MTALGATARGTSGAARPAGLRLLAGGSAEAPFTLEPSGRAQVSSIGLLQADADFAGAVPAGERPIAASVGLPRLRLYAGPWDGPGTPRDGAPPGGLLVLDGLVSRSTNLYGRPTVELYGPGDIVGSDEWADGTPEGAVTWRVHQPSALADLGDRFAIAATRWPSLWHVVVRRSATRGARLAAQLAALQLPRIDDRLEAVLWQLAHRWGRVTPDGVVVPLTLTHEMLGRLTAAKRPTVSVALAALAERGSVTRRADGTWLLVNAS